MFIGASFGVIAVGEHESMNGTVRRTAVLISLAGPPGPPGAGSIGRGRRLDGG